MDRSLKMNDWKITEIDINNPNMCHLSKTAEKITASSSQRIRIELQ